VPERINGLLESEGRVVDQHCEATLQMLAKPSFWNSVRFAGIYTVAFANFDRPPRLRANLGNVDARRLPS
jgi:hypothetical protein